LIAAWNREGTDPASEDLPSASIAVGDVWRLDRIEASGFGGLTLFGGPQFDLRIDGENWCLEGQNGSGKTSLTSAILWALTGKRIREQDGPVEVQCARLPVTNKDGKKIGEWPFVASYPSSTADLLKSAEVWVRLTFKNAKDESATATRFFKRLRCSGSIAVLESLNPDGTTAAKLLSFDGSLGLPKLTHALEVIGVLFELPQS